jgi:hypothetical protein
MYVYRDICFFRRGAFDSLDKAFCILKLDSTGLGPVSSESEPDSPTTPKDLIRRVDLIVSPPDQYPFALVSWTGSKVTFCKDLHVYMPDVYLRRYKIVTCDPHTRCKTVVAVTTAISTIVTHFV